MKLSKRITKASRRTQRRHSQALVLPVPNQIELGEGERAVTEAAAIASGTDLSDREKLNQINRLVRGDRADFHFHRILVCSAWVISAGILGCFGVLIWHKIMPDTYRFLSAGQIKEIYEFLFTGALGAGVTKGAERLYGSK